MQRCNEKNQKDSKMPKPLRFEGTVPETDCQPIQQVSPGFSWFSRTQIANLVDQPRLGLAGLLAQRGKSAILVVTCVGNIHLSQASHRFALKQPLPIHLEQFTQRNGISSIGFATPASKK